MLLHNLKISDKDIVHLLIKEKKIEKISFNQAEHNINKEEIYFENCFVFPGLINSHDHLDYNLFPKLGNRVYKNYLEWGTDIHLQNKEMIQEILRVPKALRAMWGVYKNLISGVTTVVQHGEAFELKEVPITVFGECVSLHSVRLDKRWKYRLNKPFGEKLPYVIHIGEGTDKERYHEIDELFEWNFFCREIVGVHGIAMNVRQAKKFKALVWCPDSNFFLYNKTAAIDELKHHTKILFGTDSCVSADWNIWHHLREARETKMLDDEALINSVTSLPADIWKINAGAIKENCGADLMIVKQKNKNYAESFFATNPEDIQLILHKGNIVLFDASLMLQLKYLSLKTFSVVYVNGEKKYVYGNVPSLIKNIKKYSPEIKFPVDVE
ncbi:hypothetical protein A9P82_03475 [Arachidicoccus ginsenosidimutans]|uniref:amidohydrolase family protein n=1 Tax=Arachidicoccus sp. BS20 TaxID=1850526 RepID=UPI0007F11326|nr:amidohydrolase family protein [Arachidicoccus sp. BS20]ANI88445.1 hypothetical protein A9P82_03475 [Arachidicoccus sp. BS20]